MQWLIWLPTHLHICRSNLVQHFGFASVDVTQHTANRGAQIIWRTASQGFRQLLHGDTT
jgi:hypothetical protein